MTRSALNLPQHDPTPIFEYFRGNFSTNLLAAAITGFQFFEHLAAGPKAADQLREELQLAERSFIVLLTGMRAMGLVHMSANRFLELSPLAAEHLVPNGPFFVGDYVALAAESPDVQVLIAQLRANRPEPAKQDDQGAAFIFRAGLESAMDHEASARRLTLALAGRAKNVAPLLAARADLKSAKCLLDIGGGTGIYSIACLQHYPHLRAIVWDRPEVLKVTREFASEYGVAERLECRPGDMFADPVPPGADVVLLSNILHDWDVPECRALIARSAAALSSGGKVLIHDAFLNDALDGPLPIALYSVALFTLTEGRAYSAAEYREWLSGVGLAPGPVVPTLVHCGIMSGTKT